MKIKNEYSFLWKPVLLLVNQKSQKEINDMWPPSK